MVNPGHASKGCVNCKTRRIKCDETRPNCQKCVAGGRTCLGYRGQQRPLVEGAQGTPGSMRLSCDLNRLRLGTHSMNNAESTSMSWSVADTGTSKVESLTGMGEFAGTQQQTPSQCILDTVATCFESLWDPAQSRETRRLMLQSYRNALRILRIALFSDPHDHALITPTRSLAIYEVCCSKSYRPQSLADWFVDDSLI